MLILFFCLWLLTAGEVTAHTCLWGAAVSVLMSWFCRRIMGYRWKWSRRTIRRLWAAVRYVGYLLVEMLKAGLVVMKLIYTRGRNMEPKLIWFDTTLQSDGARAVLADSITLTAGTITVEAADGRFCVHALDASLAQGIEQSEFQKRLEQLEA